MTFLNIEDPLDMEDARSSERRDVVKELEKLNLFKLLDCLEGLALVKI